jgi:hypothetical protein
MAVDTSAIVLASMPADTRSSTSATADKAEEVAAPAAADSDHRIWTQLRIAADYDALMADPVKLQAFKQDVAACLRESIGHPEYLQGAGEGGRHALVRAPTPAEGVLAAVRGC